MRIDLGPTVPLLWVTLRNKNFYLFNATICHRGSFNERDDSDIFTVDKSADSELTKHPISKKAKAALPPRCLDILQPWTQVPDPIKKR